MYITDALGESLVSFHSHQPSAMVELGGDPNRDNLDLSDMYESNSEDAEENYLYDDIDERQAEEAEDDEDTYSPPGQYTPTPPIPVQSQFPLDSEHDLARLIGHPPPILAHSYAREVIYTPIRHAEEVSGDEENDTSMKEHTMDMKYDDYLSFDRKEVSREQIRPF